MRGGGLVTNSRILALSRNRFRNRLIVFINIRWTASASAVASGPQAGHLCHAIFSLPSSIVID
jgi:hypothetical protein